MSQTGQGVIAIQRPTSYLFGGSRDFILWIDGQRTGRVKRRVPAEFTVDAGEHTLAVSMDWVRSQPVRVVVEPGSRTELAIGARSGWALKFFLPIFLVAMVAPALVEVLRQTTSFAAENWLLRSALFVVGYAVIFAGYLFVTLKYCGEYWAMYTLGPTAAVTSSRAEQGAAADRPRE